MILTLVLAVLVISLLTLGYFVGGVDDRYMPKKTTDKNGFPLPVITKDGFDMEELELLDWYNDNVS